MGAMSEGYSVSLEGKILQGRFRIDKKIARGGMAWLFKAWDLKEEAFVAIKLLFPHLAEDQILRARFVKESALQCNLHHPHIVRVATLVEEGELLGSVMEWIDGEDLKQTISRHKGPMELKDLGALCLPILDALGYAHASGLVHRDIKPANILLYWRDGSPIPKLTDFGIAKALEETEGGAMTSTGSALGTMRYMSPEQIRDSKNVDHRADLYSFGVVMYQLATGEPPFRGSTENLMFKQLYEPPVPPRDLCPSLPIEVEQVILRALQKKPEDRFESCPVLADALSEAIVQGLRGSNQELMSSALDEETTLRPTLNYRATHALRPNPTKDPNQPFDEESLPSAGDSSHSHHSNHPSDSQPRYARDDSSANSASFSKRMPLDLHQDASSPNIQHHPTPGPNAAHAQAQAPPPDAFPPDAQPQRTVQTKQVPPKSAPAAPTQEAPAPTLESPFSHQRQRPQTAPITLQTPLAGQIGLATLATPISLPEEFLFLDTAPATHDQLPAPALVAQAQQTPFAATSPTTENNEEDYFSTDSSETMIARAPESAHPFADVPDESRAAPTQESAQPDLHTPLPSFPHKGPHKGPFHPGMATQAQEFHYTPPPAAPIPLPPEPPAATPPEPGPSSPDPEDDMPFPSESLARPFFWKVMAGGLLCLAVLAYFLFAGERPASPPGNVGDMVDAGALPQLPGLAGQSQPCPNGQFRTCYPGPKRTLGVGPCKAGKQQCLGQTWGPCKGARLPAKDDICNGRDDDCNGKIDDGKLARAGRSCTIRKDGCRYRGRMVCNSRRKRMICRISAKSSLPGIRRVQLKVSPTNQTFQVRYQGTNQSFRRHTCIELQSAAQEISLTGNGYALCVFPLPYQERTWYIRMQRKSLMEPAANYCMQR